LKSGAGRNGPMSLGPCIENSECACIREQTECEPQATTKTRVVGVFFK